MEHTSVSIKDTRRVASKEALQRNGSCHEGPVESLKAEWKEDRAYLIASDLLSNVVQRLYYPEPKLLPLLILVDYNVLDVSYQT